MKHIFANALKFLLFTALGCGILYYVFHTQDVAYKAECTKNGIAEADCSFGKKLIDDMLGVNYFWVFMTVAAFTVSNIVRAYRWEMLLHPLGYKPRTRNTYLAIMLAYLANLLVSRVGEAVRCTLLARYEKIPVNKLLGTVVIDRLLDVICLAICIGLTFLLQFNAIFSFFTSDEVNLAEKTAFLQSPVFLGICALGVVGLGVLYSQRARFADWHLYDKIRDIILGFWDGLKSIGKLEKWWLFLFHTFMIWFMYYLMTYFCFKAFAPTANLSAVAALTVFVFGSLGMVIPSPGGMGTFHYLVKIALVAYGVNSADGFSFANIQFIAVNTCILFFGLMALFAMPYLNKTTLTDMLNEEEEVA